MDLVDSAQLQEDVAQRLYTFIREQQRCSVRYIRVQRRGYGRLTLAQVAVHTKSVEGVPRKPEESKHEIVPPVSLG
eukprot:1344113-Amorphochlora_amoeboformis.AAC.1